MKGSRYCQLRNPISGLWVRVDRKTGTIVGRRKRKYACPVYKGRELQAA